MVDANTSPCCRHFGTHPNAPETSADPAGLTAKARPEARSEKRAANLPNMVTISQDGTDQGPYPERFTVV
jgi:hypothetical protein